MQSGKTLVIGAGIAGLAAARALQAHGCEVVVLEARERTGGRCWTRDGVDLGAHWIHGTEGNPVTTLARVLGIDTLFVGGDSTYTGGWDQLELYGEAGALDDHEKQESILLVDSIRDEIEALRRKLSEEDAPDVSLEQALVRVLEKRSLEERQRLHLEWHLTLMARDDWGAAAQALSLLWFDEGYEVYGYGDSVLPHGMQALTERLAEGLDVRLGHVVTSIERGENGVRVVTSQGEVTGAQAIVTLPLGVLKAGAVDFVPPLPEAKRAAIDRLGMGALTKIAVRFEKPCWPENQYVFGCVSGSIGERPALVVNQWKTHRLPILVLIVGGACGERLEAMPEPELRELALGVLNGLFGALPEPLEVTRTAWNTDPFTRGAYSYLAVGATPEDIDELAEPVDDLLFFAGEATHRHHWACLHGAYVSGLREAARITGDDAILPSRHFVENRRWREMLQRADRFFNLAVRSVDRREVDARLHALRKIALFERVPSEDLRVLATMVETQDFVDGELICRAGEPATRMYAVASGQVLVILPGASAPVATMAPGDVVGEYGMFGAEERTATLVARGPTRVLSLDYPRFRYFLLAFPEAMLSLMSLTVSRLKEAQRPRSA